MIEKNLPIILKIIGILSEYKISPALSAGAVEYADCTSAEG